MITGKKMTPVQKMRAIRQALKMTQRDLAVAMNYGASTIDNYENGRKRVTKEVDKAFRKATDTADVPFTDDEIADFKEKRLYGWNNTINFGIMKQAKELQDRLAYCVKWSFDEDLQILYDIFSINYYCATGKKEECNKILDNLKNRQQNFTDEYRYWYYRYLGTIEHWNWRYKAAAALYMKAEKIGNRLGLNDNALYYNIGNCLTHMGYPILACDYLENAKTKAIDSFGVHYMFAIQKLLAVNYSKTGKVDRAIELLNKYIEYIQQEGKSDRLRLGRVHTTLGKVYQNAENFEKALENFDIASRHFDVESELYLSYLCYRALLLRAYNKNDEAAKCLDKGFAMATTGTLWYELLSAIRYSLTLDKKGSIESLEFTTIPKLNEYGVHETTMACYEWISDYYKENNMHKPADEYNKKAMKIYKQLIRGDLSL